MRGCAARFLGLTKPAASVRVGTNGPQGDAPSPSPLSLTATARAARARAQVKARVEAGRQAAMMLLAVPLVCVFECGGSREAKQPERESFSKLPAQL